jgi:protein-S-isoprenylcysteine O-methyltransferase Ste14
VPTAFGYSLDFVPPLLAGLIVAFYWGRVIKLVVKTRQQTGQSAHFLPPEPLGRAIRIVWYPTVGLWILVPLVTALSDEPAWLTPHPLPWLVAWIAAAVCVVALALTMVCWKRMGRDWRMGIDPNEKNRLIISGPYAIVRHPIYALSQVLVIATMLTNPSTGMIVVAVLHMLFLQWEARREERHLLNAHGEAYAHYMRTVGRFLPKLT